MTLTTPKIERRHSDRRRACLGGTLRLAAFLREAPCRLRDHSLTGARIVVAEDVVLPRVVDLTVTGRNETRRAEVVWRDGTQAGLAFLDQPAREDGAAAEARAAWNAAAPPDRLH
ncbi:PilZ domain-containing protein [Methylobacterium sp. J-092]|uniref:PilZ domain-containing protein n=1 Tax=Methylobacterium sp. J-092 TaxID=2836667 RepID=UPI001FBBAC5B|nr:PilZ domain-containing protein [Methylobacterium sp. J-092]MCJ2008445.1 PilZ domain-containing protein [Methylobacterium sp. J-092]